MRQVGFEPTPFQSNGFTARRNSTIIAAAPFTTLFVCVVLIFRIIEKTKYEVNALNQKNLVFLIKSLIIKVIKF